jgi:hypothetical protein
MFLLLRLDLLAPVSSTTANSLPALEISAVLDCIGVGIAIWTVWSCVELPMGGQVRRAFLLISLGSLAFALSHVLDTILQLLDIEAATLIHQGAVLLSILCFLPGLADLTDALTPLSRVKTTPGQPLRLVPFAVGVTLVISAGTFILYGMNALAETVAFFLLDGSVVVLSGLALLWMLQARLGGAIGRSLWLASLGLLLFSLAHPVQVWFYEETVYPPDLLVVLHRLLVMPAFFLFAFSINGVARRLTPGIRA